MDWKEILTWSGSGLLLILSFIKLPKIEVNLWGWLAKTIGKHFNDAIAQKIDAVDKKVTDVNIRLDTFEESFTSYKAEMEEEAIRGARQRILLFNDELLHDVRHTQEHFNEILFDIDNYEDYCRTHPDYSNNRAIISIKNIKSVYEKCCREKLFI